MRPSVPKERKRTAPIAGFGFEKQRTCDLRVVTRVKACGIMLLGYLGCGHCRLALPRTEKSMSPPAGSRKRLGVSSLPGEAVSEKKWDRF